MKTPTFGEILAAVLSCVAVITGAVGAYVGTIASLIGLTVLLTARVMAGRPETVSWSRAETSARVEERAQPGPVKGLVAEIREAESGDKYARAELANLVSWLSKSRTEGAEAAGFSDLTTARRVLLAGSRDSELREILVSDSSLALSTLRGRDYLLELEHEVELIRDG